MDFVARLTKNKDVGFFLSSALLFVFLRLPSLFEPYWYGDEGIYQVIGSALQNGRLLYQGIWDNKPPLLYVVYALGNADQFTVRLYSLLAGLFSIFFFFQVAKKLFTNSRMFQGSTQNGSVAVYLTTLLFSISFGIPFIEGNIANAENFMLLPVLAAVYYVLLYLEQPKQSFLFLGGIFCAVAFLFKAVGVFDYSAFFYFLFVVYFHKKDVLSVTRRLFPFLIAFCIPIVLVALFFAVNGAFFDFYNAAFGQMVGYIGYGNRFIFAQGLLFIKLALLGAFLLFLFVKRNLFSKSALFIFIWVAFSTFNAFFAQRPYTHYVLVLLPSFLLLFGILLENSYPKGAGLKNILSPSQLITLFLSMTLLILLNKNFRFFEKNIAYYQNFFAFITHQKSTEDYRKFFDSNTPNDYIIADYIKLNTKKQDTVFIWGNSAQIYKLSDKLPIGRFAVAYHITANKNTVEETYQDLKKSPPKLIVITRSHGTFPYSLIGYNQKAVVGKAIIYEASF